MLISLFLFGCNKEDGQDRALSDDPVIGVRIEGTGETVYTKDALRAAIVSEREQIGTLQRSENPPDGTDSIAFIPAEPSPIADQPAETLSDVTDREALVAVYSAAVRAAIAEAAGDRFDADFGYNAGTITLYGAGNVDVIDLERYLEQLAAESGLQGYDIQIGVPVASGDIPAPVQTEVPDPVPAIEPAPAAEPSPIPTTEPAPTPEPEPVVAPVANNPGKTITLTPESEVWKTATGKKFHNKQKCGNTNPDKAEKITVKEAVEQYQLEACDTCYQGQY
ncbi:MAG: hypothetical protein K6G81_09875 [Lachnospiraceae bacterium]|nr:hypothetical protein [Lachnospiraceae bacterium]